MTRETVVQKLDAARERANEIDRQAQLARQIEEQLERTLAEIDGAAGTNNGANATQGSKPVPDEHSPSVQGLGDDPELEFDHDASYLGKYSVLVDIDNSNAKMAKAPLSELVSSKPSSPEPRSSTSLNRLAASSVDSLLLAIDEEQRTPPAVGREKEVHPFEINDNSRYFLKEELKNELRTEMGEWHSQMSVHMASQFAQLQSFKDDLAARLTKSLSEQLNGVQINLMTQIKSVLTDSAALTRRLELAEEEKRILAARVSCLETELKNIKEQKISPPKPTPLILPLDTQYQKLECTSRNSLPGKVVEPSTNLPEKRATTARTGQIPKFSGENENWNVWYNRFLSIGRDREWTEADYLSEMKLLLVGRAGQFVFGELSFETRENYTLLVNALQEQFKEINLPEVLQQEFEEREQRPNESLREYMSGLRSLHCQAWPTEQGDARRTRLVSRFLRGISNPEVSRHISVHYPSCDVAKCVEEAMRYDALQRKYLSGAEVARRIPGTEGSSGADKYTSKKSCSYCKRSGHWASDCWKKQKDTGSTPSSPAKSQNQRNWSPNSKKGSPKGNRPWLPQGDNSGYGNNMPGMPFPNMQQMMPPFGFPGYNFPPFGYPPFNPMFPPFQGSSPQQQGKKGSKNFRKGKHHEQAARRVASDAQGENAVGATASAKPANGTQEN